VTIYESVDLPGACPRIGILFKIEKFLKNKHSHMFNIGVYVYLRALFFGNSEESGQVSVDSERAFSDSLLGNRIQNQSKLIMYKGGLSNGV